MIRALDKWLPGYLASVLRRRGSVTRPRHLLFCVADHFEPLGQGGGRAPALRTVERWLAEYPRRFGDFRDADGRAPVHTFFYPQEEYDPECLDRLAEASRAGWGEVEVHLHHRGDTAEGLRAKLLQFRDCLHERHGLLGTTRGGARYGFVHGNWALCNSRPDGDWCGVNEEIGVLAGTGCYADFTFPSAPSGTQPRMVNAIYYARDRRGRPRGADGGRAVRVGIEPPAAGELMLVTGPLAPDWRRRKFGLLPRLENGALTGANPPAPGRVGLWVKQRIGVAQRSDWVFVKVYTHGSAAGNIDMLLGEKMQAMHGHLQATYNDGMNWRLHYVSAREMFNLARAAIDGRSGDPGAWRNYEVEPPPALFC